MRITPFPIKMIVTAIKTQERSALRENIYLDGKFSFSVATELRFEAKLKVGQEVSEDRAKDLVFQDQTLKLLSSVQKFLAIRPRSEKEIRNNLQSKLDKSNYLRPDKIIDEVLNRLRKYDFVNDRVFAKWWVSQRQNGKPRGERMLRSELYAKGVPRNIIDQQLYKYESPTGEIDKVAAKKFPSYQNLPDREFRQKMSAFLGRRGYDWDEISMVIKKMIEKRSVQSI
jgi:regulatory protein